MMQIDFFAAAILRLTLTKRSGRIWRDPVRLAFVKFSKKKRVWSKDMTDYSFEKVSTA